MGERFTLADICVIPTFDRMADLGYKNMWEEGYPAVTDWVDRSLERPSVKKAFYEGSRFSEVYPDLELGR
jgi:glutathione S-transferase